MKLTLESKLFILALIFGIAWLIGMFADINQNYVDAYIQKGWIHVAIIMDFIYGLEDYHKALNLTSGKERAIILRTLGGIYGDMDLLKKQNLCSMKQLCLMVIQYLIYFA